MVPAFIALSLYALLPIVRNTHAGLQGVPRGVVDAAFALGLRPSTVLARSAAFCELLRLPFLPVPFALRFGEAASVLGRPSAVGV